MARTARTGSAVAPTPTRSILENYVLIMKALGDATRLDMVCLISTLAEYPCTSLEHALPVAKSTISYHIRILSHAGLVSVRRQGRHFFYTLHRDVLEFYVPGMLERLDQDLS